MSKSFSCSLWETIKIKRLKITIDIWKNIERNPKKEFRYAKAISIKVDLRKTWYLNTAIMESEWIISFKKDIWDGPKYLNPLIELISLRDFRFFLTLPE